MATKSILKTIHIRKKVTAKKLINALEHADGKASKAVKINKTVSEATREEIRKMFGDCNDGI